MLKRKKKGPRLAKARKQIDEDSWRAPLEATLINDESCWCIVTMMVETIPDHSSCVSLFKVAAEEGRRKAVRSLSHQKTLAAVRALSRQSLGDCPPIQTVCHHANSLLNEDKEMSSWLMARVLKYLIYRAKEEIIGIGKRKSDLEREVDEEFRIMGSVVDWGRPGSKGFDIERFNNKANTKLRKRDEEWRDIVYVDDAPINGPNLYVVLTGFHDPDLPEHLIAAGVPLTAIVRIKRPNEHLDHLVHPQSIQLGSSETKKLSFLEEYTVSWLDLFKFWTTIEKRLMDPETHPAYCDLAFLTFCPPELPKTFDNDEFENLKKDMYDRVSYIVYDIYDLCRQHGSYLKSLKMQEGIVDECREKCDMETYETILNAVPQESVSVPLILFAMLVQVEENDNKARNGRSVDDKGDAVIIVKSATDTNKNLESSSELRISFVEQKAKALNIAYDLKKEPDEQEATDIELILHGDSLIEAMHFLNNSANFYIPSTTGLIDGMLSIFWHPAIMGLHSKHQITKEKLQLYASHIDKIRSFFDVEINPEEVKHYLHILMFDRMLHPSANRVPQTVEDTPKNTSMEDQLLPMNRSKSEPSLSSRFPEEINFLSDSNIDYGKMVPPIVGCPQLFDLIDPREVLVPGYLETNVFMGRRKEETDLKEFEDVELLARQIFLQLVHQCLARFDRFEARYFEPTDSVLLCFSDDRIADEVHGEERMCSIRTPVCLREFCEYVVAEEKEWIAREEELYRSQTSELMRQMTENSLEMNDQALVFRDEDFILPGSLKAKDLQEDFLRRQGGFQDESVSEETSDTRKGKEKKIKKKRRQKDDVIADRISPKEKKADTEDVPQWTRKKDSSADSESYEFIGYDLGRLRVQVTSTKKTFCSADGTLVRLEIDDWLHRNSDLRIMVAVRGYSLRLLPRINGNDPGEVFHLTTPSGIIVAFEKQLGLPGTSEDLRHSWRYRRVDFRVSWPSGLVIEPITGDGPDNPFYIRQSYIPTSSGKPGEGREVSRKFLRNGTVLKYLDDGKIIVLRLNGDIVTCTAFKKHRFDGHERSIRETNFAKGDGPGVGLKRSSKSGGRESRSFKFQLAGVVGDPELAQQDSTTSHGSFRSLADTRYKVSGYRVLNHDGRQYEVLDDLVVSEQHRLLVRTSSDHEVDEKFTRRGDGTNMLLKSNGELIVEFPDGTRITTAYEIEKEPLICAWTEEEVPRYFRTKEEVSHVVGSFSSTKFPEDGVSTGTSSEHRDEVADLSTEDAFVSVLLTCRIECKNYATVFYDQSAASCTLSMPDGLRVSVSGGRYEVSMADGVNLKVIEPDQRTDILTVKLGSVKVEEDSVCFRGNACTTCGSQSKTTYNLPPRRTSAILATMDVFGNMFGVNGDGSTTYHRKMELPAHEKSRTTWNDGETLEEAQEVEESEAEEDVGKGDRCGHQRLCFGASGNRYRIFSMNRDLTAFEYLHRSARDQTELEAVLDNETSVILYPTSRRPELRRLITFKPMKPNSRSKDLLSFPELKPLNVDRRELLRTTYAIPYDWTFPYGKHGIGIWENTDHAPFTIDFEKILPELLEIRIQYGFKEPAENAVIDLQRALGRYWLSLVLGALEPPDASNGSENSLEKAPKTIQEHLEHSLQDLALGIKKRIDVATYKHGLERQHRLARPRAARRSIKFGEFLKQRAVQQEKLEWYKRCIRERVVLPYFQNITGTCFLLVQDCMKNALEMSSAGLSCESLCQTCATRQPAEQSVAGGVARPT